jgi:hypothetical protein
MHTGAQPWAWAAGVGSAAILITDIVVGAEYMKVQCSAAQTAPRTFTLMVRS